MDFSKILEAIENSKQELLTAIRVTNKRVENIENEVEKLKLQNATLEKTIETQTENILFLNKKVRSRNLVIFGVKEEEETREKLENFVINLINEKLKIPTLATEIDHTIRLGRPSSKTRPILITLTTEKKKIEILCAKSSVQREKIFITQDYSREERNTYKSLKPFLDDAKSKGLKASIRNGKLRVNEEYYTEEELKAGTSIWQKTQATARRRSISQSYVCEKDDLKINDDNSLTNEHSEKEEIVSNQQATDTKTPKNDILAQQTLQHFLRPRNTPNQKKTK